MEKKKRIMLTGARSPATLDLARHFHAGGCEVYVADTAPRHICRFSGAVKETIVIPSPRFQTEGFLQELGEAVMTRKIDLLVPSFEESIYIAQYRDRLPASTEVFLGNFEQVHRLHNKWSFLTSMEEHGFATPKTEVLYSQNELERMEFGGAYILKQAYSRASLKIYKVEKGQRPPKLQFDAHNPWIAQEWLEGRKFCTYSVCHDGYVHAHSAYPVKIGIDDASCVMFEAVEHRAILGWVQRFAEVENITGQMAFDFIETEKGLFAIECNPRSTSGVHLFRPEDGLWKAFLEPSHTLQQPRIGARRQIFMGMLLYGWKRSSCRGGFRQFLKYFFTSKDVVFSWADLKPWLMQPFLMAQYLRVARNEGISLPAAFNYDLEWNGDQLDLGLAGASDQAPPFADQLAGSEGA